jgi:hypothetical protein
VSSLAQAAHLTIPREVAFESEDGPALRLVLSPVIMMGRGGWLARRWADSYGDVNLTWLVDQGDPPTREVWLVSRFSTPPPEAGEAIAPLFFVNEPVVMVMATLHPGWPPGLSMRALNANVLQLPTFPEDN